MVKQALHLFCLVSLDVIIDRERGCTTVQKKKGIERNKKKKTDQIRPQ